MLPKIDFISSFIPSLSTGSGTGAGNGTEPMQESDQGEHEEVVDLTEGDDWSDCTTTTEGRASPKTPAGPDHKEPPSSGPRRSARAKKRKELSTPPKAEIRRQKPVFQTKKKSRSNPVRSDSLSPTMSKPGATAGAAGEPTMTDCMNDVIKRMEAMERRLGGKLDKKIDSFEERIDKKIDTSMGKVELRINGLENRVNDRMDECVGMVELSLIHI